MPLTTTLRTGWHLDVAKLHFDGADSDYIWFSAPSWSGTNVEYTISIRKADGVIACTCLDAECRRKNGWRYDDPDAILCKHAAAVVAWIRRKLNEDRD